MASAQQAEEGEAAEEAARNETVATRVREELDPLGMRLGGFQFFPSLAAEQQWNDNIFAADGNEIDDYITVIRPGFSLNSDFSVHALGLFANSSVGRYWSNSPENYEDVSIGGNGRYDLTVDTELGADAAFNWFHEERGSPDDVGGEDPTEYTLGQYGVYGQHRANRFVFRLDGRLDSYNYDDARAVTITINNDDRDRDQLQLIGEVSYEIQEQYTAFLRARWNEIDYDEDLDDAGVNRDSDGYGILLGARIDFTGLLFGDVAVGYREQSYDDAQLSNISGPLLRGTLFWNPTPLTTVTANAGRAIQETTQAGASGFFSSIVGLRVDHELLRNLILSGGANFTNNEYEGIRREEDTIAADAGFRYLLNRHFYLSGRYEYTDRDVNVAGSNYTQNIFKLEISTQL